MSKQLDDMIELFSTIEKLGDMEEFFAVTADLAGTSPTDREMFNEVMSRLRGKLHKKIKEQTEKIIKKD